jgi:multiple sugar transport system ATP-binding protein
LIDAVRAESQETKAAHETEELAGLPIQGGGGTKTTGVARVSPRSTLRAGAGATLYVDTEQLHFFDPSTGSAIWA